MVGLCVSAISSDNMCVCVKADDMGIMVFIYVIARRHVLRKINNHPTNPTPWIFQSVLSPTRSTREISKRLNLIN